MALNPLDRLVRDMEDVKRQLAGRSQLNHSSLENTAIPVYDGEGTERLRIGAQDDGTHSIKYVQGPPPPRPTAPMVSVDGPVVRVRWDGELMGGHIPEDFARIDVHFALASDDLEDASAVRGNLVTGAGSEVTLMATQTGTYRVGLVAMSQSRARSEMSDTVEVEVQVVDLATAIETATQSANGKNTVTYSAAPPTPADEGVEGDTWWVNETRPRDEDDPAAGVVVAIIEQWQHTGGVWAQVELAHEVIASVDLGRATVGFLHGERIEAGTIDTPQLAFGAATGDILAVDALDFKDARGMRLSAPEIRIGDSVEITEEYGFRQFGPDGALNVNLPSDGSESQFRGDLSARSLIATGRMEVQGHGAIAAGGDLVLESGVTPPGVGPQVVPVWEHQELPEWSSRVGYGVASAGGYWWRITGTRLGGPIETHRLDIQKIDPTDPAAPVDTIITGITGITGRVVAIGNTLHIPSTRSYRKDQLIVHRYSTDGQSLGSWADSNYSDTGFAPGFGTDGVHLIRAQCGATGILYLNYYDPQSGEYSHTVNTGDNFAADVTGVYVGNADFGSPKIVVTKKTTTAGYAQVVVFDGTAPYAYRRDLSWRTPGGGAPRGLMWEPDRGQFATMGDDGNLTFYPSRPAGGMVGDGSGDWWAAVGWRTGSARTPAGPPTRFQYPVRAVLQVQSGDVPQGVEAADIYLTHQSSTPTAADLHLVGTNPDATTPHMLTSVPTDWATRPAPPGQNTFVDDAPGEIRAAAGGFRVDGSGAGEWGPLTFHDDGTMTGIPGTAAGVAVLSANAAANGGKSSVVVTFPPGRFDTPPAVTAIAENGRLVPSVEAGTLTKTSVQLNVFNWTTTASGAGVRMHWTAVEVSS